MLGPVNCYGGLRLAFTLIKITLLFKVIQNTKIMNKTKLTLLATTAALVGLASNASAAWLLVDDFNRADSSTLGTATNGQSWTDSTGVASISNNVAQVTDDGGAIAVNMGNTIANNTTGTTFFQFRYTNNLEFDMGFLNYSGSTLNSNRATTIVAQWDDTTSDEIARGAYGGSDPDTNSVALTQDTWYNVWIVADNTADEVTYYLNTGTSDASTSNLFTTNISGDFRNTISGTIDLFGFDPFSDYADGAIVEIDNIYVDNTGANLINAIPEPSTFALVAGALGLGLVMLRRRR